MKTRKKSRFIALGSTHESGGVISPFGLNWKETGSDLGAPIFEAANYRVAPVFGMMMKHIGFSAWFGKGPNAELLGDYRTADEAKAAVVKHHQLAAG